MSDSHRCLDEATIALHAGGELSRWRRWLADRQLAACPRCRAALEGYRAMRGELARADPVPEIDFAALAHNVRVTAEQSGATAGAQPWSRWAKALGAGLAAAALVAILRQPDPNEAQPDPTAAEMAAPAALAELDIPERADAQLTGGGSLRVESFHSGSTTLTITDYYAP